MPKFDRINGRFTTRFSDGKSGCAFSEAQLFKDAGWKWDSRVKGWCTSDIAIAQKLRQLAVGEAVEHLDNAAKIASATVASSWAEDTNSDFPAPDGLAYMPFQKAGIEYCIDQVRTLIADSPGLGKTITAIGVHNTLKLRHIIVICPASLKINWKREWEKWDVHGLSVGIAESKSRSEKNGEFVKRWTEHIWPDTAVVVVNYDMLEAFDDSIKSVKWDLMIADEAHLLKSYEATRTKAVFGGFKRATKRDGRTIKHSKTFSPLTATRELYLTGTPILSKPIELWTLLQRCDPSGLGKDWEKFAIKYCDAQYGDFGWNASGSSNAEELSTALRSRFMIRRDKRAVLKELPDKIREPILLPQDKLEAVTRRERTRVENALDAYERLVGLDPEDRVFRYIRVMEGLAEKFSAALAAQNSEEPDWEQAIKSLSEPDQIMFTEMSQAREEVALAKVGMVADHVKKLVDCEEPVIVFAYHKSVIAELKTRFEKQGLSVGVITGSTPIKKRQEIVDDFQDGKYDIALGNIIAMGVGWTLTRARFVVFAELDWVPSMMEQAEDRAWRIGQENSVVAQYLLVDGSIEARIALVMLEKIGVIKLILDSKKTLDM